MGPLLGRLLATDWRAIDWRGHAWQTVRLVAACGLASLVAHLVGLKETYWAVITAIVVTQPVLDDTLAASRNRILGTLIGAATGLLVLLAARNGGSVLILFWCALVPLALLTALRQTLRIACITLVVVVLIPSSGGAFERPIDRVFGILAGTMAAIAVSLIVRGRRLSI